MSAAPARLGRYIIEAELGRGAMGVVYRARDPRIDRLVALKALQPEPGETDAPRAVKERFLNEGRAAGRLNHPGIVAVYDADEDPATGIAYLAMEHVEGGDLRLALKEGLTQARVIEIVEDVAAALDHAHERGVVHRDVKPANILLDAEGRARLTDFGIARLVASTVTMAGEFLGTPAYMAPEQVLSRAVSPATDVFALGVILYEGLTGKRPFDGSTMAATTHAIVSSSPVRPSKVRPTIAPSYDAILARALAKSPEARFRTAGALARAAAGALEQDREASAARRQPKRRSPPVATVLLVAAVVVVGGVLAGAALRRNWAPPADAAPKPATTGVAAAATVTDPAPVPPDPTPAPVRPAAKPSPTPAATPKRAPAADPPAAPRRTASGAAGPPSPAHPAPTRAGVGMLVVQVSTFRAGTLTIAERGRTLGTLDVRPWDAHASKPSGPTGDGKSLVLSLPTGSHSLSFSFAGDNRVASRDVGIDMPLHGSVTAKVDVGIRGKSLDVKVK